MWKSAGVWIVKIAQSGIEQPIIYPKQENEREISLVSKPRSHLMLICADILPNLSSLYTLLYNEQFVDCEYHKLFLIQM